MLVYMQYMGCAYREGMRQMAYKFTRSQPPSWTRCDLTFWNVLYIVLDCGRQAILMLVLGGSLQRTLEGA